MSSRALLTTLALAATLGCEAYGVRLGEQQPCVADQRLANAQLRSGGELVSRCAVVEDNLLGNAGFESPLVGACQNGFFCQFSADQVPAWQTTSATLVIEIWNDGHQGVVAYEGAQFVELDARSQDTLWQDLALPPGQLMYWSLAHRGRIGVDSLELRLGPPDATVSQGLLTSAEDAWYPYSGLYRVGATETVTRVSLVSRSGTDKGNFVDAVYLAVVQDD